MTNRPPEICRAKQISETHMACGVCGTTWHMGSVKPPCSPPPNVVRPAFGRTKEDPVVLREIAA